MLGLNVLIVEEEFLIAAEMEATLLAAGAASVLIERSAHEVSVPLPAVDIAIIEAKMGAPAAMELAAALRSAGVALVVTSADRAVTSLFTDAIPLEKPFDDAALLAACAAARHAGRPLSHV